LYTSPNVTSITIFKSRRIIILVGHAACMGQSRNAKKEKMAEQPEGKRPIVRNSCKLGDNIKVYLNEIVWEDINWMHLAQDRD
jgi:hypothetical protein